MKAEAEHSKLVPRVLHFAPGFRIGGIESLLMGVYRCLDKDVINFDLVVDTLLPLSDFDEIRREGGRVFQLGRYLDAPVRYQRKLKGILARHGREYIALHSHSVIRALPVLWAARNAGIRRRILHSHTDSLQGSRLGLLAPTIAAVTRPMATDFWACSEAAGRFFFGDRRVVVWPNTIAALDFAFNPGDRQRVRKDNEIDEHTLVVGHTGRFTYPKNHDWIIRVLAELRQRHRDAHLLLVGDGPGAQSIRSLVNALRLAESVTFVGSQRKVAPFLSAMDVLLFPSHFEGFGISLLEAQANGLPCLASDVISEEVRVTPSLVTKSLNESAASWAEMLLWLHRRGRSRSDENIALIEAAGYDAERQVPSLIACYLAE